MRLGGRQHTQEVSDALLIDQPIVRTAASTSMDIACPAALEAVAPSEDMLTALVPSLRAKGLVGVKTYGSEKVLGSDLDTTQRIVESLRVELGDRGRMLLLVVSGSHAYGTATPESDVDYRGTFAHGRQNLLSLESPFDGINRTDPDDVQVDSLKRVLALALQGKFSMAEMLFVPKKCVVTSDPLLDGVMAHRDALVSRRWFRGILGYFNAQVQALSAKGTGSNLGRMRPEYTRGPECHPEEQYDGKFALHAIRLGNVGVDLAETGRVVVNRPEAEFLLQVREGEAFANRTELVAYLRELDARLQTACERSCLQEEPDQALWNRLYREVEEAV